MSRAIVVLVIVAIGLGGGALFWLSRGPVVSDVGPRRVSNQTAQPLALTGERLRAPLTVVLRVAGEERTLTATVLDATHAYVRLPADLPGGDASIVHAGRPVPLTIVDDRAFPDPVALAVHDGRAYVVSQTTDELFMVDLASGKVSALRVGDGPRAIAFGSELVVGHAFDPMLAIGAQRVQGPRGVSAIAVHENVIYVAGQVDDDVWALDPSGRVLWKAPVAPNPRAIAVGDVVAVGSEQAGVIELLDRATGKLIRTVAPTKETRIISGRTEPFTAYIMGGKGVRGLAFSGARLFVASIGPNIGPNPQKLEVTHDGGAGVIDGGAFVRHVGLGAGVTEALLVDGPRLYATDIATGRVHVFDLAALSGDDAAARGAWLGAIAIPPPPGTPLVRPDLDAPNRSGNEVHSGPHALATWNGKLVVLNRFSCTLAIVDPASKHVERQIVLTPPARDTDRRLGQVLFYADLARSGMSCDSCHPDGHMDGVFFEKTRPQRIYRSTTVRGSADTPPYFVPTSTRSLRETNDFVGNRNRFGRLAMTARELDALTLFTAGVAVLPNPHVGDDGAPRETLALPDGRTGNPRAGLVTFTAKCSACHPPPLFTTDQAPKTRDEHYAVGTPRTLPLRPQLQDGALDRFPAPALLGAWDNFPMLTTGAGGLSVDANEQLVVRDRFVLRDVLTLHGGAGDDPDLLAYLLSL